MPMFSEQNKHETKSITQRLCGGLRKVILKRKGQRKILTAYDE
jgi:hypothetical protein